MFMKVLASHFIAVILFCSDSAVYQQYHDLVRNSSGQVEVGKITLNGIKMKVEIVASAKKRQQRKELFASLVPVYCGLIC